MQWFGGRSTTPPAKGLPQGKALLLIGFNEGSRTWEVNPEAMALLQRIPGPLCTLAVCGRARQGKSFLLNTLLGRLTGQDLPQGFQVSPTQHSCTRGLWMWTVPVPIKDADGKPCNLLLVDCEGVDAVDQGQQHSAQVFSLAVLLSSVFVYNQLGAIDAIALERLAMVCELAKRVKDRSAPGTRGGQTDFHPAFVWLLRDFQLQLSSGGGGSGSNGGSLTPGQYLEEVLADVRGGGGPDENNRNNMRRTIKAVFPDRDAATLLRPMLKEEDLHRLDTIPYSKLRPEFRKGMDDLMSLLRSKSQPLQFSGHLVSGSVYSKLAEAYVKALNQGAVPQLVTAWQGVARAESQKAYDAALSSFQAAFKEEGCADDTQLYDRYQAALSSALRVFKETAMGDATLTGEFEDKLRQVAEERFKAARTKMRASSEAAAESMLAAEAAKLRAMMAAPNASLDAVDGELRRFLAEYDTKVSGPWKYRRASEFLMNTILGVRDIVVRIIADRDAANKKAADAEARVVQLRADLGRASEADSRASAAQKELAAAKERLARAEGQLAAKTTSLADSRAEVAQLAAQVSEAQGRERGMQREVEAARQELARLQSQLGTAQRAETEATRLRSQLQSATAAAAEARSAADSTRRDAQAAEARTSQLQSQLQALQSQLQAAKASGQEVVSLRAQLADAQQAAEDARLQVSRAAGEKDEERAVANRNLREVTELQGHLLRERERHDETKEQLSSARQRVQELERQLERQQAGSAGAATLATGRANRGGPAASGRTPAGNGAIFNAPAPEAPTTGRPAKRRRQDMEVAGAQQARGGFAPPNSDERAARRRRPRSDAQPMEVEEPMASTPAAPKGAAATTPRTNTPRTGRGGRPSTAATPASPSTGGPGGTPVVVQGDLAAARAALLPGLSSMSVAAMKSWVTDHRLEDEEFMALVARKAKKAEWAEFVRRRAGLT